ncbi:hypothetical protein PPYR_06580 [Photinus pyralis]|uniref:COMM domain-containing protein 5 n=1 Tax=Photinus pyralis TaxID=7054 RepID=A0A1Y1KVD0_PHOPY|nr:uncharacterized protein LOC116166931 [Photinus pyralis]KAB0800841.1 hypothetical protein PPYR_06580 [Photinus pyralis]
MSHLLSHVNKNTIQLASRVTAKIQEKLVKIALDSVLYNKHDVEDVENFAKASGLEMDEVLDLIGFHISVIRIFMQSDEKQFWESLISLGCNEAFIKQFPLKHKVHHFNCNLYKSGKNVQRLSGFKWRVDISFTSGILKKQVAPTVIINLELNTGHKYIVEIDLKTFHKLRFNIALAVKENMLLENSSLLRNRSVTM